MLERNDLEYLVKKMEQDKLDVFYYDARTVFDTKELEQEKNGYKTYYHRENHYQQIVDGKKLFVELMKDDAFRPNACLQLIRRDFLIQRWYYLYSWYCAGRQCLYGRTHTPCSSCLS